MNRLQKFFRSLELTQTRCVHCLRPFSPSENACGPGGLSAPLCPDCTALFVPYAGSRCPRCGLPLALPTARDTVCPNCLRQAPPWDSIGYFSLYDGVWRDVLLRLKYAGELSLAPLLGACLQEAAHCLPRPDALVPVPRHPLHLRKRGFNQAHELAKYLHILCGVPLRPELLCRPCPHTPQAGLSAAERRRNISNAFQTTRDAQGLRLWIIDDVMTTGATLTAAALTLRKAGAQKICALFVARTPHF
ncbi:MAG: ComF/GntX family protein [Candidatus Desulfovibrio kirbyi]|uniref:ComF/GntX family protein n=1 Tax=Candidatus Desulfovibrio kirbyi TaxID=2696086 RepID=A0A6L2R6C0_9BACT|nr:MAG: ComF/GntX family protein [Candidatus Desulfovibrio kirbyi]